VARTVKKQLVYWVPLPEGAERPVSAFVNGTERREGDGITVRDGRIWFDEPIRVPQATTFGAKVMLSFGVGMYGDLKGDTLDIHFQRGGRTEWITNVPLTETAPPDA
jgi:hypothetical protein